MLSAVESAVSVTHVFRAAFETGLPSTMTAAVASFVPLGAPSAVANRPISEYVRPRDDSSAWIRIYCGKQRASLPVSIDWFATLHEGRLTLTSPASSAA